MRKQEVGVMTRLLPKIVCLVGLALMGVAWSSAGAISIGGPSPWPVVGAACGTATYLLWAWKLRPETSVLLAGIAAVVGWYVGSIPVFYADLI